MTWTYSGNPSASALDAIRFLIGDTDTNDPLISNEEIAWVNSEASGSSSGTTALYDAAYRSCLFVASKLARLADKSIGDLQVSMSQKAQGYLRQSQELKALAQRHGGVPTPYAGGISISDKDIDEDNSDSVRPYFSTGQFSNVDDGAGIQDQTGIQYFGAGAD